VLFLLLLIAGITIAAIKTTKKPTTAKPLLDDEESVAVVPEANTAADVDKVIRVANTFFIFLIFYFFVCYCYKSGCKVYRINNKNFKLMSLKHLGGIWN
jgi:hypothetical protein